MVTQSPDENLTVRPDVEKIELRKRRETEKPDSGSKSNRSRTKEPPPREPEIRDQLLSNPLDDGESDTDLLGRAGLINILKGIIDRDASKHLTIALFGKWGSGKSSVIRNLGKQYEKDKNTKFIVFNAWQNEHSENIGASLAERMVEELYDSRGTVDQIILRLKQQLLENRKGLVHYFAFLTVIFTACLAFISTSLFGNLAWRDTGIALLTVITAIYHPIKSILSNPFSGKLREMARRPDFSAHIGINHGIRRQLSSLLKAYSLDPFHYLPSLKNRNRAKAPHKFVVVIDDLDRCAHTKILEVLAAIQLIVDLDKVVVILAVDQEVLIQAVASRYTKSGSSGSNNPSARSTAREYLGKILQITIALENPDSRQREKFISERLFEDIAQESGKAITVNVNLEPKTESRSQEYNPFAFQDTSPAQPEADISRTYSVSDQYLSNSPFEMEFFARCVGMFDIHNPRTMLRTYNTITLLKGLHPDLLDDDDLLAQYIFLVFWFESACSDSTHHAYSSKLLLGDTSGDMPRFWQKIAGLSEEAGIPHLSPRQRSIMLSHISDVSLPYTGPHFSNA